jgi:hypothetical protein
VQRRTVLLQHGAILLDRLSITEPDLLVYPDEGSRATERARLGSATITLAELGAPSDAATVAEAVVEGFVRGLGAEFGPRGTGSPPKGARAGDGAPSLSA